MHATSATASFRIRQRRWSIPVCFCILSSSSDLVIWQESWQGWLWGNYGGWRKFEKKKFMEWWWSGLHQLLHMNFQTIFPSTTVAPRWIYSEALPICSNYSHNFNGAASSSESAIGRYHITSREAPNKHGLHTFSRQLFISRYLCLRNKK